MTDPIIPAALLSAWEQRLRLAVASRTEKATVMRAREWALRLGVLGAVLEAAALSLPAQEQTWSKVCSFGGAAILALAPFVARASGQDRVRTWLRTRAACECLKKEIYSYLTWTPPYDKESRNQLLTNKTHEIVRKLDDLAVPMIGAGCNADNEPIPDIKSASDYLRVRVEKEMTEFYARKAEKHSRDLMLCNRLALACLIVAAIIGAAVGCFDWRPLGAWVAVLTTIAGAFSAHAAANRYVQLILSYQSTANELNYIKTTYLSLPEPDRAAYSRLVQDCERVISIETQAWMADLQKPLPKQMAFTAAKKRLG